MFYKNLFSGSKDKESSNPLNSNPLNSNPSNSNSANNDSAYTKKETDIVDFLQSKNELEKTINDYNQTIFQEADSTEIPRFEVSRYGGIFVSSNFTFANNDDFPKLLNHFTQIYGELNLSEGFNNDFRFSSDDTNIKISLLKYGGPGQVIISKKDGYSKKDIDAIVSAYKLVNQKIERDSVEDRLKSLGVEVYKKDPNLTWSYIAGYEDVKEEIRNNIILPLKRPELYEEIVKGTRKVEESIKPKAVLFEGPPGTGKTTMARIIANETKTPLIYVPIDNIMTKWYGESERNLARIFDTTKELGNNFLFLDEIDSLATARGSNMHEATRRVLSVLLREIDGFEPNDKTMLIGATNRKKDLDSALIDRFDNSIHFRLPKQSERQSILENYAKHLTQEEIGQIAQQSENMSGRSLKDLCEKAERRWVSKIITKQTTQKLPPLEEYLNAL